MALDFSSSYLERTPAILTTYPITMSVWFNTTSSSARQYLVSLMQDADNPAQAFVLRLRDNKVQAMHQYTTASALLANSTVTYGTNAWHHAAAVFASEASRSAYYDGGNKGTETSSVALVISGDGIEEVGKNRNPSFPFYMEGRLAEKAIWNVALTDAEIATLALGVSPLTIRPASLVSYNPLLEHASPSVDIVSGSSLTWGGSPSAYAHPRVLYPAGLWAGFTAAAAAGTAPTAPSGLTATTASSSEILCEWTDNSSDEDNFELDYDTVDTFDSPATTVEPAANATSYNVTGLSASTLYYFRIRAVNAFGNSAYTATASDTTDVGVSTLLSLFGPGMTGGLQTMDGGLG